MKCMFLGYAQGERGYKLWCLELNSPIINREVTFDESPVLLPRNVNSNVYMDMDGVQLEVELQPETPKVTSIRVIIDTYDACSKVEPIKPTVAITHNIDKVHIRSPNRYECNNGFALSAIKEIVSKNPYGMVKGVC